jgi:hypothetical protein
MEIALLPIFFFIALIVYSLRTRRFDLGFFALLLLTLFAICSTLFYFHPHFPETMHFGKPSYEASIYLFGIYLIWLFPILRFGNENYSKIMVNEYKVLILSYFLIVVSLVFSILLIPEAIKGYNVKDLAEHKDLVMSKGQRYTSSFFSLFVLSYAYLKQIIVVLFFYVLCFMRKRRMVLYGLGFSAIIPIVLQTVAMSHRFLLTHLAIQILISFLIFRKFLPGRVLRIIYLAGLFFVAFFSYVIVDFSYKRFENNDSVDPNFFLLKYCGEGFVNFNILMYDHCDRLYDGNNSFPLVNQVLGLDYSKSNQETRKLNVHFPTFLFYSFVGDFVSDLGRTWTFLFSVVISFWILATTSKRKQKKRISLSQVLLIYLIANLCLSGVFYSPYITLVGNMSIVSFILVYLWFKYRFITSHDR